MNGRDDLSPLADGGGDALRRAAPDIVRGLRDPCRKAERRPESRA